MKKNLYGDNLLIKTETTNYKYHEKIKLSFNDRPGRIGFPGM